MWIQTKTGKQFHLEGFSADDVCLEDIAHALAMTCRYGGHCKLFYSVAEHSIHVMRRVRVLAREAGLPESIQVAVTKSALMHDAAEAYIGDVPTPIKRWLGSRFRNLERATMAQIAERYGLILLDDPLIKQADLECLAAEAPQLFDPPPIEGWGGAMLEPWHGCTVIGWNPQIAKQRFLWACEGMGITDD